MKYSDEAYRKARETIARRKAMAEQKASAFEDEIYSKSEAYRQISAQINGIGKKIMNAVMSGADVTAKIDNIRLESEQLYNERNKILAECGCAEKDITPDYYCKKCNDTGEVGNSYCDCFRELLKKNAYSELNEETPLELSKFEDFSLNYYPQTMLDDNRTVRSYMSDIFEFCKAYAESFDTSSQNLLMLGGTGLGKTHLSLAIAGEVLNKGFGVIYGSAQMLLSKIEREHFGRDITESTEEQLLSCDLLVLDDFGTEYLSPFTSSVIYNLINTRLLKKLPTIISTNLSMSEIGAVYKERIASRIIGNYETLMFFGNDVRQQKFIESKQ